MTATTTIKLADIASENAWTKAGLGTFDADSSLASEIDKDGDGNITEAEIEAYEATNPTDKTDSTNGSSADSGSDSVSYSVVNLSDAPDDFDEMKTDMNQCITSFQGMEKEAEVISQENESLTAKIESLTAQVAAITSYDSMASAKKSTYKVTPAKDETSTDGEPSTDAAEDGESATTTEDSSTGATSAEVEDAISKSNEADGLSNNAVTNLGKLSQLSTDRATTENSACKILDKTGGKSNFLKKAAICTAIAGGAAGVAALTTVSTTAIVGISMSSTGYLSVLTSAATAIGPIGWAAIAAGVIAIGMVALFGHKSHADKMKEEINKLGQTAASEDQKVTAAIQGMNDKVMATEDSAKTLSQTAEQKETAAKNSAIAAGNWDNSMLSLTTSTADPTATSTDTTKDATTDAAKKKTATT